MKKLYTLVVVAHVGFIGNAQIVNIPDANFKAKLLSASTSNHVASTNTPVADGTVNDGSVTTYTTIDTNNDGQIQVSEALAIKWLNVSVSSIADLTGIQSFTNLQYLDCFTNQLPSLDLSSLANLLYLNCYENQLTTLNISGLTNFRGLGCSNNQLTSLNISGFTNLRSLVCGYNQLPSLNVSGLTNLQGLNCSNNQLPSLNVSGLTNLQTLHCSFNQLPSLNVTGLTNLRSLNCSNNQLPSINVSGLTNLQDLDSSFNQLPSLNLSGLTNLNNLYCTNNQLLSLNVSGLINLYGLDCTSNQLSSLNISGLTNLQVLSCSNNQLPSLNVSGLTNLSNLYCSNNQLPSLNVSGMTALQNLYCYNNHLPSLNVSGLSNLQNVSCSNNQLTSLNVSGLTTLQSLNCSNNQLNTLFLKNGSIEGYLNFSGNLNLEYICADEGQVASIQTQITGYGFTNCHVNSYCSFTPGGTFYTIQGNNRYDSNSNGCDVNDINYTNLKLSFTDGTNTGNLISDATGAYRYDVQVGTQTFAPVLENNSYFTVSPTTATVTFPAATSPYTQNFCVTASGVHNDLEVVLLPISRARPGFNAKYKIIYKNKGTAVQSGNVGLTYDSTISSFVLAIPSVTSQVTNNLSWSFTGLQPFETRTIDVVLHINTPTDTPPVHGGDVLTYTATVVGATDETPNDNTSTLHQTVVNSLDPNDKTCVEGATVSPSMVGQYVHYVVRFENDGTANAQNVVVKDMIDTTKFDVSSLIPLSGSASYTTRIANTNQVEFIFQNINLPFAAGTNTGYVAFKIKTKPTLVVGDTFSNSANIYFDYNAPIVTNTATTTIATLGNQDFDFGSVFTLSPVPAKNTLTIATKQDVTMRSVSIYNMLGQLVQVHTNPSESIDVSGLQSGSYFMRIASDKGSATGKFIKE